MSAPLTLDALFSQHGRPPRYYHMGRRIEPCSRSHLQAFEQLAAAWQAPWHGQARLAIVFEAAPGSEPGLWCLALPLDEQGLLQPAHRDALIERLLSVSRRPAARYDNDQLSREPLAFQPDTVTRALLHARVTHDLAHQASAWWAPARDALTGITAHPEWTELGWQGIADAVVRRTPAESEAMATHLPQLPVEGVTALCYCLEHVPPEIGQLVEALRQRSEQSDPALAGLCRRAGLSSSLDCATHWVEALLAGSPDDETLAIIAARGWQHLEDEIRLTRFLHQLALRPFESFHALVGDLALIPRLRLPLLLMLRQAERETALGHQVATMLRTTDS